MYKYKIFDSHCDTLCMIADHGGDIKKNTYNVDTERMRRYAGYTQIFACFIAPQYRSCAMHRFKQLYSVYKSMGLDGMGHLLSVENCDMLRSEEDVEYLFSCGVRCASLTWNYANGLAGGALDEEQGLTELGKRVVRRMNELGILIDVSHLNDKSFYDVAAVNTGTLIATHSNARAVCGNRRNLSDDMFRLIRESGGAAGINLYPPFVTQSGICTAADVLRHIEHFVSLGGEDAVGIGADFDGTEGMLPQGIESCGELYKLCNMLGHEIADKITYKNWQRIFKVQGE